MNKMKPGDWTCPKCADNVFASKQACRCGQPKPTSSGPSSGPTMRPGDWTCPQCYDHVFASKAACRRCSCAKPVFGPGDVGVPRMKSALELVCEDLAQGKTIFKADIPRDVTFALERQGYTCKRHERRGCGYTDPWDGCDCHSCRSNEKTFEHWEIVKTQKSGSTWN